MAKNLSLAPGIGSDVNFLNGNIVDLQTIVNSHINQDIVQFFQKLMSVASLSANNNFDNEANGYQFIEAFKNYLYNQKENWINLHDTDLLNGWICEGATPERFFQYRKIFNNKVEVRGHITNSGGATLSKIITFPNGYKPSKIIHANISKATSSANDIQTGKIYINTSGDLFVQKIQVLDSSSSPSVFIYPTAHGDIFFNFIYSLD